MTSKLIYSKKGFKKDTKVGYSHHGLIQIEGPGGKLSINIDELISIIDQARDLMDEGVIIPLKAVESSNIEAAGFCKKKSVLRVKFKKGGLYDYSQVPENVFKDLIEAESVGRAFHATIRNEYPFQKIKLEDKEDE